MGAGVPRVPRRTQLALGPGRVVDAAEAVPSVGVAALGGPLGVGVPAAVTRNARARRPEETGGALVTAGAREPVEALVAHRGAARFWTGETIRGPFVRYICIYTNIKYTKVYNMNNNIKNIKTLKYREKRRKKTKRSLPVVLPGQKILYLPESKHPQRFLVCLNKHCH